ncbi:MAG: hypothetical protein KA339_04135 [Candidatus Kapabacteria bacterium]|nr:hypothetical protein [Ignavibacteria bacterium]MBP6509722.1 hypothetical protein [Candidatus Kapabacteria bacterium]MBP7094095.1 hypothetical protein [Candidatus Kapabacteria bacterium]
MKTASSPLRPFAFLLLLLLLLSPPLSAQISISDGTSTDKPNLDAAFEVSSSTQGILLPRLKLISTDSPKPLRSFSAGMIVYNLSTTDGETGVTPGLYFCDGERWVPAGGGKVVVQDVQEKKAQLRGIYRPPMECRTFDIHVDEAIPENAVVMLTLEHAGETPTCLAIREIDRERGIVSVNSSQLLPTFARIHWMVVE